MLLTLVSSDPVGTIVAEGADDGDDEDEADDDGCSKVGGLELSSDVGDDVDDMIASYFKCGSYDEATIMSLVAFSLNSGNLFDSRKGIEVNRCFLLFRKPTKGTMNINVYILEFA